MEMKDEVTDRSQETGSGVGRNKYIIRQVVRKGKDGNVEHKAVCIETDDIEAFREKMKGNKFESVFLTYERQ